MTLVIGVDPGGTTGLAAVDFPFAGDYRLVSHLGVPLEPAEVVRQIEAMVVRDRGVDLISPWWIAAERFVVSRRAGRSSNSAAGAKARAILGALEAAFPGRIKLDNASAMKMWIGDGTRLKTAGLVPTQGRPHTTDAAGHALRFHVVRLGNPDPISSAYRPGRG